MVSIEGDSPHEICQSSGKASPTKSQCKEFHYFNPALIKEQHHISKLGFYKLEECLCIGIPMYLLPFSVEEDMVLELPLKFVEFAAATFIDGMCRAATSCL